MRKKAKKQIMNWQPHFIWVQIEAAVKSVGWGPSDLTKYLRMTNPSGVFDKIGPGIIRWWITTDEYGNKYWKESTKQRVAKGAQLGGRGRSRALVSHDCNKYYREIDIIIRRSFL
jgi:hypothetical protein